MSESDNTVLLEVYRTVGKMESAIASMDKKIDTGFEAMDKKMDDGFQVVHKRVDTIEQKMDEKKKDFKKGFLYPVAVFLATTALGGLVVIVIKLMVFMDSIAKGGATP